MQDFFKVLLGLIVIAGVVYLFMGPMLAPLERKDANIVRVLFIGDGALCFAVVNLLFFVIPSLNRQAFVYLTFGLCVLFLIAGAVKLWKNIKTKSGSESENDLIILDEIFLLLCTPLGADFLTSSYTPVAKESWEITTVLVITLFEIIIFGVAMVYI